MSADTPLRLGISPCPNDTFIFSALLDGRAAVPGHKVKPTLLDVEELNYRARKGEFDVCKISVAAAADMAEDWLLLRAGGALGRGVGPLLVARSGVALEDLEGGSVAVPGLATTGHLLLRLFARSRNLAFTPAAMVFSKVTEAVLGGRHQAGVLIHEGRFTYADYGLEALMDLGAWWEEAYDMPVPLGVIAVRRDLGRPLARAVNQAIIQSLETARRDRDSVMDFVRLNAQELELSVIEQHIETFVTDYSLDVGEEGERACLALLREAARMSGKTLSESGLFLARGAA